MTDAWISAETEEKERHFRGLLDMHVQMCKSILTRFRCPPYLYADLHAGPGRLEYNGRPFLGSPLIFLETAARREISYEALCFEKCPETGRRLADAWAEMNGHGPTPVRFEPFEEGMPQWLAANGRQWNRYGLVYADPIGTEIPYKTLAQVAETLPKTDLLSYVSGANYKRRRGVDAARATLDQHIKAVGKKYVRIREPLGKHQWTFILWTDWKDFPDWRKIGLHRLDSERGRQILDQLNLTTKERHEASNVPLWGDDVA